MLRSICLHLCFFVYIISTCHAWHTPPSIGRTRIPLATRPSLSTLPTSSSTQLQFSLLSEVDYSSLDEFETFNNNYTPFLVAIVALAIGAAAQTFINQMLEGDQGLGAFLKDGAGYNKSGFRQQQQSRQGEEEEKKDPLPWLRLPKLDFVDVAGQEDDALVFGKLEELRVQMNNELELGNTEQASRIKEQLEEVMEAAGIEYNAEMD